MQTTRHDDPDWLKDEAALRAAITKRQRDEVERLAVAEYPHAATLDVWGHRAGIKCAPHRRPSQLVAEGVLVAVGVGRNMDGNRAGLFAVNPDRIAELRDKWGL